ncbi:MAG: CoA-binding protein [Rhodobacteraceae bacterium]|nr:CoA-binding protein [Paracoccaceae bacterium]
MTTNPSDALLRKILTESKTFACIGVSMNPVRPSYFVARYLSLKGFRVIPVNPGHAGESLFGEEIYPDIASIPGDIRIDVLDLFRRSEHVPPIVEEALRLRPELKTIWMQIGVQSPEAEAMAQDAGKQVVQNRCPKIEYQRLFGELRMGGFNTGVLSSKL